MRVARTILALFIAVSVAVLPAAGGLAVAAKAIEASVSAAMPDCAHHHGSPIDHSSKAMDDCTSMASCAAHCFNFVNAVFADSAFAPAVVLVQAIGTSQTVASQIGNPPFRPPRV